MRIIRVEDVDVSVLVAAGAGSATFDEGGMIDAIVVTPPTATPAATYDIAIQNYKSRPIWAKTGLTGTTNVAVRRLIRSNGNKILLTNVSDAGTYTVTPILERGM